jgi:hypothetical protein
MYLYICLRHLNLPRKSTRSTSASCWANDTSSPKVPQWTSVPSPRNPLYSHVNWGKTKILTPPVCIEPFPFALPVRGPEPEQFYTCHGPGSDPVSRSDKQTM